MTPDQLRRLWLLRNDLKGHEAAIESLIAPAYPDLAHVLSGLLKVLDEIEYPKPEEPSAILSPIQRHQI